MDERRSPDAPLATRAFEVLLVATRLGATSFGGPIAHLGYFRAEYVERRRWLSEQAYADLVALCQFLPGPASSQVGIAVGMSRAGLLGGVMAWLGFTLPSAIALVLFAIGLEAFDVADAGWIHGLQVVAVAVVAQAVWGMARNLAPDRPRATIAILGAIAVTASSTAYAQIAVIGWRLLEGPTVHAEPATSPERRSRGGALVAASIFVALLLVLPLARQRVDSQAIALTDAFYRTGSLVFGGGHVVLPLLEAEVVDPGWVTEQDFIAGYGAAQAVPGPLFSFSAYLGAVEDPSPNGWLGASIALVAIYVPSFLLLSAALPAWSTLRSRPAAQSALRGVNAGVVGILGAALYDPIFTSAILRPADFALALAAFGLLAVWRLPPWIVVVLTALGGAVIEAI
ncbi:MAG: chromate efflux transporter [Dehalococcoidia bacterium]